MMIKAKMKILLQLVVWIFIAEQADCHGIGFGIKKEIFFLNLEDGYFGCQVNESTDFLQLYELSRLCDGRNDCYMGSDELARELKCTRDCNKQGPENKCLNGACLDSQCHCNDGFGGCSCEVPDENECKSRPCDVFAHCTNTLGSFHCTCFPGYAGDGFHCQDINECEDPLIAARCVPNSECCNLPAHFLCKCLPGFQGDGEEECVDIDECLQPGACGPNAICQNIPGNYTCTCQPGFQGNPLTGCTDIDECTTYQGACGVNAICSNTDGGYICACPLGTTGDPFHGACIEIDECLNNPCGLGAICMNTPTSYTCICPPGFVGDPYHTCSVIGCVDENDCPSHQSCYDHTCQDPCVISNPCALNEECQVHEHHPACVKVCQCQKDLDCQVNSICDGCRCIPQGEDRVVIKGCEHCPPGLACDQLTGACIKAADASTPSHTEIPTKFTDVTIKTDTTVTPPTTTTSSVDETDVPEKMTEQATKHTTDIETTSEMGRTTVVNDKTESNIVTTGSEMHLTDSSQSSTEISGTHDEESTTSNNFDLTESNIETTATTESPNVETRTLMEIPSTSTERPVFSTEKTSEFDEPTTMLQPQTTEASFTTSSVTEDFESRSDGEITDQTRPEHDITTSRVTDSVSTESIGSTTQLQQSEGTTVTNDITTERTITTSESVTTHEISEEATVVTESPTTSKVSTEMTTSEAETIEADTEETFHTTEMTTSRGTAFDSVTSTEEGETTTETIKADTEETFHATEMTTSRETTFDSVTRSEEGETTVITSGTTIKQSEEVTSTTTPLSQTSGTTEGITEVTLSMQTTSEPESFKTDSEMTTVGTPATEASSEAETTATIDESVEFLETTAPSPTEAPSTESQTEEMKTTQSFSTQSTSEESLSTLPTISGGDVTESITSSTEAGEETSKMDDTRSETSTIGTTEDFHKMTEAITSEITTSATEEGSEPTTVTESLTTLITKMLTDIPSLTTKMFTTTELSETTMQTTEKEETEMTTVGEGGSTTTVGTTSAMQHTESTEQETSSETTTSGAGKATETVATTTMVTSTEGHETTTEARESAETEETSTPSSEMEVSTEGTSESGEATTKEMTTISSETDTDTTTLSGEMTTVTDSESTKSEQTTTEPTEGTTVEESTTVTSETTMFSTTSSELTTTTPTTTTESIPSTTTKMAHRKTVLIQTIFGDLIKCKDDSDCEKNEVCSNRVCKPCPLGTNTVDCQRAPIGRPKKPQPCEKDTDCLESEACYNGMCEDLCGLANLCAPTAKCHVVKHRPVCTCPPGHQGNPAVKCFLPKPLTCIKNEDCGITEACIGHTCQHPCDVHNPCAQNAVCINTNHGCDCVCSEGYYGNGYVGCIPGLAHKSVCQYNEDCPDDKLCDRLNRVCINPCSEDSCGENAQCIPVNHGTDCRCLPGYVGNAYLMCSQVSGCRSDLECATNEACIQGRCGNPCHCGPNAICDVINHKPICKCLPGYGGNAKLGCTGPLNPCDPNPCGINAHCEVDAGGPICYCPKGMTGNPFKNCIPEGNECSPNPCGPNSGCRVVHGSPVCFCLPEYEGNPPGQPCTLPRHPCNPSPCGPNTQCSVLDNGFAKCTCLPGYIESPNTIRGCVERSNPCYPNPCGHGALCDRDRNPPCYCPDSLVGNPYRTCAEPMKSLCQPGPCGLNADCYISGNTEQCYCRPGTTGDPYTICNQPPRTACWPNPCGPLAVCTVAPSGHSMCLCPDGMAGDPTTGCGGPQCVTDDDCTNTQACVGHRCIDPCPGSCGFGASCRVEKHHPICTCNHGLIGNPLCRCFLILGLEGASRNPCEPSPCGFNTNCRVSNGRPVCSCLPHYLGDPKTGCRPECILNSDCPSDSACISQRCVQPCSSTNVCGLGAICTCSDHTPFCSCPPGYHGDPYIQCIPSPIVVGHNTTLPCAQSPCGPDAVCSVYGQVAMCNPCGKPESAWDPKCRPECLADSDCPYDKACLNYRCISPCPGSCGVNAHCTCVHHKPVCSCPQDSIGNPFEHCAPRPPDSADRLNTCDRIRCGSNAKCHFENGVNVCRCLPNFYGDPYLGCHPECVINSDCGYNKACINYKCVDPCSGACGVNALCTCVNHIPICHCPDQHTGDPFVTCYPINPALPPSLGHPGNPCDPSPCGPNSRCIVSHQGFAVCSCLPGYRGVPPVCQPDCLVSSECLPDRACINQKCTDPCPGLCGIGARCLVMNHNPVCSCPPGQVGDPFIRCHPLAIEEPKIPSRNPCEPTPCGPNSICIVREGRPVCSCSANYIGSPPYCRPECVMSQECPHDQACIQEKCKDPCSHNCGTNAQCHVVNHTPFCSCLPGYQGDAFVGCYQIPATVIPEKPKDPCDLWPCAENAQCSNINGVARCTCIPPYVGDPYSSGCKPECLINADCAPTLACLSSHCRDPCPGVCGNNAQCSVVNHIAVCTCFEGYIGDPFQSCRPKPVEPVKPINPCDPNPCGANSVCRVQSGTAACSCIQGYIGVPPSCRPECIASSECNLNKACINQKCIDPCPGTCGLHANCHVINHNPICSCPPKTVGDPFVRCIQEVPKVPVEVENPCMPSPCGGNSQCLVVDHRPVCSCLPGMLGAPPNCRPECLIHADCPNRLACIGSKCKDPCVGSCGFNALCNVVNHQPICSCQQGYHGDPFSGCSLAIQPELPRDPCNPSPCGPNAVCKERNGAGSCTCLPEYSGDPYSGCRPECVLNTDCPRDKACSNNKCRNPCPGICGSNAECRVVNHAPSCSCLPGYTGNPLTSCHRPPPIETERPKNPCIPSPCGPYSICRVTDNHAVCSCQANYVGSPPACRPECMISADCAQDKACLNQKCADPCPGTCGLNARCQVVNHNPICSCPPGFKGDPFARCLKEQKQPVAPTPSGNPCVPSPCGPNSQCRPIGNTPACSCSPNYVGRPPNCRPECTINAECAGNLACQNERCRDPCPGSCGPQATCQVIKHNPQCSCLPGYTGDPFAGCSLIQQIAPTEGPKMPCNPSPCGANAVCKERNGAGSCACLPEYFGDPYTGCRPECVVNTDCDRSKACMNNKCKDPCPGTCGLNAECHVINHAPSCTCLPGFVGDPISACRPTPPPEPVKPGNPCQPSPCGPYSACRVIDNHAVCSCQANYIGSPPTCRPECMISPDCAQDKACLNQKCGDPCPGTCGLNARCQVVNHNPICSCSPGFSGDPFSRCIKEEKPITPVPSGNPCVPSPCGPNSECRSIGNNPACSCSPNYVGRPPNCRPECTINAECAGNLACQNERCRDPCPGSCGPHATCQVVKHNPQCSCLPGYTGDPFAGCSLIQQIAPTEGPRRPCNPSPCGANAICKERNGAGSCSCLPEYFGDPYTGCRPECVTNAECDKSKACVNNKCKDPCIGTCGLNAECRVINHAPSCTCLPGYSGNPLSSCTLIQSSVTERPQNPCVPSPCGPNSICKEIKNHAVCTCQPNFVGSPPTCRPECIVSSECQQDKACINQRCSDPCPGTCGLNARCQVLNHNPICSCSPGFTGDPFVRCLKQQTPTTPTPPTDPCQPSPCGPYSQCRSVGTTPACSCLTNYIGRPPNCRPECIRNAECASNLACQKERCVDPCPGSCGYLAQCKVVNHNAICTCPQGYVGDATTSCQPAPVATTERTPEKIDPCFPSPCGANAECHNRNGVGACSCLAGFQGDPYTGCRRECESNVDCATALACIGFKCVNPCPGTCGTGAECTVANHIPICSCPPGFTGDPFFSCHQAPPSPPPKPQDPCFPSPCGPNSQCRTVNQQAVCSCMANYIGNPPTCRPECVVNSECTLDRACINQKCADPCPNTCGLHAQCTTKNHNPICACPQGYTGDPFSQCHLIPVTPVPPPTREPLSCSPSPCGPNSQCQIVRDQIACSCLPNYLGNPPNCRPECVISSECSSQLACINQKCKDPCTGSCGANANCRVVNHVPVCSCDDGYTGDPFTFCSPIPLTTPTPPAPKDPCNPSPCGPNAVCRDGLCECVQDYSGNPYEACRPECVLHTECSRDKACFRNKCRDPCPGTCGQNAQCDVVNHIPTCSCPQAYTGDPFTLCRPLPTEPVTPADPCNPSPCGPNSQCRAPNNVPVCSCLPSFMGSPPACRPECLQSAECSQTQACVNKKCTDPCLGSCGLNARCQVINHSPICSCPLGQTGDPFKSCYDTPVLPPPIEAVEVEKNPCQPSPCGPNSQCLPSQSGQPSCSCMTGYIGSPPNCRPECVINPDCPSNQACINNKCVDPCPGTCGINAQCSIISHAVACTCLSGFTGNAFVQCVEQKQEVKNPCEPSPCGPNAECTQRNGAGSCSCIQDYTGNPYEGCRPECVLSSDCPTNKACVRNKCEDPCPGVCGQNAQCSVINHIPTCTCVEGYVGNPFVACSTPPPPVVTQATITDACSPSPCGPNSQCRNVNNQAVCSCASDFQGTPPNCRPECVVNSECPTNRACYKNKCTDPCPGTCGLNARCQVINHNPICSCPTGQTGDPFTRCYLIPATTVQERPSQPVNPCTPSPCGSNSVCQVTAGNQASCSCLPSYIGSPPNCRPECVVNTDCSSTRACITEKCRDPCIGSCGLNADCRVQNHIPTCSCTQGFTGDPFTQCSPIPPAPTVPTVKDPCNPSPCGANANCNNGQCTCLPDYFGDPYIQCRPECTMNSDCTRNKACSNQHCVDPCPGTCGQGATCDVINHIPTCSCPPQTTGDPFTSCRPRPVEPPRDPCNPSPCGANSICRVSDGHAVCTCQSGMIGTPPQCRPECVVSAECPLTQACLNSKCRDPCVGTCGLGAKCNVVNHNPICSCPPGQTGDPFRQCYPIPVTPKPVEPVDPCRPSPCGPNSDCKVLNGSPACSCLSNYIGAPPNCRPECTINPECAPTKACVNQRCIDPCPGSCGSNARCSVINHTPICSCNAGFTGDPFTACSPLQEEPPRETKPVNPCLPSPCGPNAVCRIEGTYAVCECSPEYQGNPYEGCRPECVVSSDCAMSRACIRNKCRDPCPGTCGLSAICTVSNHIPICSCPEGYEGNAFTICTPVPKPTPEVRDPCIPSPCGPNTQCNKVNDNAVCSCLPGFQGVASGTIGCRPECVISPDCPRNRACVNNKCVDPCPGVCGYLAVCHVVNHSPICSCPPQFNGDPFVECQQIPVVPDDPCNPSPCGQNGQCHVVNGVATCIYPECVINQDCPRDKACYTQRCRDPCSGACGLNAICQTVNHKAVCSCPRGYIGEPRIQCQIQPQVLPKPECSSDQECANNKACINQVCSDPCQLATTSVCAYNAECRVQMHRPLCVCREGLTGNAQNQCFDIGCRSDSECPPSESCVNKECVDPCRYTQCGTGATCHVVGGKARCRCPPGYFGDSLVRCERAQCTSDSECPSQLACRNLRCQNPCDCAKDALCTVTAHVPTCRCPPGYIGNPHQSCTIAPIVGSQKCKMDADCSSKLACFSGDCRNPCFETNPCGDNAECLVVDTLPLRTMSCQCLPGFIGDADVKCTKAPQEGPGCSTDLDCVSSEICVNHKCVNPCEISNPCAKSAICQPINHKAVCKCPDLLVGDPFVNCYKVATTSPECKSDLDCPFPQACINQRCQDPCIVNNPCGTSAECTTIQHRPTCTCPQGWAGNPQIHCYKPECKEDVDCVYDKACIGGNCISPCGKISCGRGAECVASAHAGRCVCPAGTQGDPHVSCISVACHYNEDCADHEACDRLNRVCRPVCEKDTCGRGAECSARRHQPQCHCLPGTQGDPYIECTDYRTPLPSPECQTDADCPTKMACLKKKCQNPCSLPAVCSPDQECSVLDSLPLRTVMCVCPSDTIASADGHCMPIVGGEVECRVDTDCRDSDRCVRGSCKEACRIDPCGLNAQCASKIHQSICTCPSGYVGNPHIECTFEQIYPVPQPIPECTQDDECSDDKWCRNRVCLNPCAASTSCAPGAFCHAQNHKPICKCPAGFSGNPLSQCIPPSEATVGCSSNSECSPKESCINRMCVSPCNCGIYAECKVQDHYPICYCQPGYSGNPQIGCIKVGCEADNQCNSDQMCYNGECINPCIVGDVCGANSECYGSDHRAKCQCLPGYVGSPMVRCDRVECSVDADCPSDRTCLHHRCLNPCVDVPNSPCAQNAICFVKNHVAACRCPEYAPLGNPLAYCHRLPPPTPAAPECERDVDCPTKQACIRNSCKNPCAELSPCSSTALCNTFDTTPIRTMVCTCPEGWVPDNEGECKPVIVPTPPGCTTDSECSTNETCINRMCRNPCDCGPNAQCFVSDHRPICSCIPGYDGNPNIGCLAVGCRSDSECASGKACINGNCINPCIIKDPCGPNAECYAIGTRAECRCLSGYRGNPYDRCLIVGCRSNSDCPNDRACINAQCINPCVYEHPCAPQAECQVQNHLSLCRCPADYEGNPYVSCRPRIEPECKQDGDCPSLLACFNGKCKNPCTVLEPCQRPAKCEVVPSLPVRTMICECPPGYISSGSGTCQATPPVTAIGECVVDKDCSDDKSCINAICKDPCNCGPNAECRVKDHKPICSCLRGFDGNPDLECVKAGCRSDSDCSGQHACLNRECVPVCSPDGSTCGTAALCYGSGHHAVCSCPPGLTGDPQVGCIQIECETNSDCPSDKACLNTKCVSPCTTSNRCIEPAECTVYNHIVDCSCPPGYVGTLEGGCKSVERKCEDDSDCPSQTACINSECVNPCNATVPCGINTMCQVFDTYPVRTMICECLPGYNGNAAVQCDKVTECPPDKGFVRDADGNCVCPPGTGLNVNDECERCLPEKGMKIDDRGRCVCDLDKGFVIDERGRCVCPVSHGYTVDINGNCSPGLPECTKDDDCEDYRYCNPETKMCDDPCLRSPCGINAFCNATRHVAVCQCKSGYIGDAYVMCNTTSKMRTDFPRPDMVVSCLSDGVQVEIHIEEKGFNGVLYVKGHSKDEKCRRVVSLPNDSQPRTEIFKVNFGTCGLIHVNGQASFVLVIQKHPMLVTFKTQAYHIKCVYTTGEQNVTLGFNVSMLTTAGTIANTGPPPTCLMRIVTQTGQEINSAEIGDNLKLQVDVQPASIYGGFARSCVAKTMEDTVENEYIVTDENGCATDPSIFGEWDYNAESQSLLANFNAFKFPSSDNIRFQCNIRVCFGKCQPVNCRGYNAFGRRRRDLDDRNNTVVEIAESVNEGQLREEITIQSNAILTFERRGEERFVDPTEAPSVQQIEDICVSMIGFIIAIVITALLSLVAVAVAVSCWLIAYRRRPKTGGPLPHPPEFPNPLFTTPEPLAEPSPDYLS